MADSSDLNSELPVDLLVGVDYYRKLVTGNVCRGEERLTAAHTKLEWVPSGPLSSNSEDSSVNLFVTHFLHLGIEPNANCALDNQLRAFWDLEFFGVTEAKNTVLEEFQKTIHFTVGKDMKYPCLGKPVSFPTLQLQSVPVPLVGSPSTSETESWHSERVWYDYQELTAAGHSGISQYLQQNHGMGRVQSTSTICHTTQWFVGIKTIPRSE